MKKVRKGVIIAAGLGTRFLPVTKVLPKEMLPVMDKPVLQYIVEEMADSGIEEIIFVINKDKRAIEDYFARDLEFEEHLKSLDKHHRLADLIKLIDKVKFTYTYQNEPLGNGHALLMAKELIGDEPFAFSDGVSIIDSKTPVIKQLLKVYNKKQAPVIGLQRIEDKEAMTKYGNAYAEPLKEKGLYKIKEFVEKPNIKDVSPEGLIVGGMRFILNSDIWPVLENQKHGKGGEVWLVDAANVLAKQQDFYAWEYEGKYLDTGNDEKLLAAVNHFFNKRN